MTKICPACKDAEKNAFNLKDALNGAAVKTKDGRIVTDIKLTDSDAPRCFCAVDEYEGEVHHRGVSAVIHNKGGKDTFPFYHSGVAHKYGLATGADLIMA